MISNYYILFKKSISEIFSCLQLQFPLLSGVSTLVSVVLTVASFVENMWSVYGPLGMLVENKKLSSVGGSYPAEDIYLPYVVNDISTFFTLLVGIYFPSVTGEAPPR